MNTHTILNVKTDKKLKQEAKSVAEELGVPLSTVINAFLKQFVRDKTVTLSATQYQPTPFLAQAIKEAEAEIKSGKIKSFDSADDFIADLKKSS